MSNKHINCLDFDLSNGSHTDDDNNDDDDIVVVPCNPVPILKQSPKTNVLHAKDDTESTIPRAITEKPECIAFHQKAVDVAIMNIVVQFLNKRNLRPEQLSDEQLKSYIQYVIDLEYYKKNIRSGSVESHVSVESSHSR